MLSSLRKCHLFTGRMKVGAILSAAALAGCSANVSRFDLGYSDGARGHSNGSYGTTGRTASADYGSAGYDRPVSRGSSVSRSDLAPMTTAAIPPPAQQQSGGAGYGQGYSAAPSYNSPNYNAPSYGASRQAPPSYDSYGSRAGGAAPTPAYGASAPSAYGEGARTAVAVAGGDTIEVRPGDTLYSLSRSHGVSVAALKAANGLSSNDLRPGQQLHLPSAGARPHEAAPTAQPRESYETVAVRPAFPAAAEAPSDWTRRYTVRPGDSLYAIARESGVKLADLERHNGITDSRRVQPGTVLRLPGRDDGGAVADTTAIAEAPPAVEPVQEAAAPSAPPAWTPPPTKGVVRLGEAPASTPPPAPSTPQQPTMLNGTGLAGPQPERLARVETNTASDAVSPVSKETSTAVAGFSKLRWPVTGRIISGFGPRPDGTHNDGVNFSAPLGTDVHAAESGVVAYAGDELKGYGNLVLVRHDNGWVTAYAHADEILVKRGDQIKRGQVIAKAGRTGQVDQPQVHFELRQGQKPVDPTPFMERL